VPRPLFCAKGLRRPPPHERRQTRTCPSTTPTLGVGGGWLSDKKEKSATACPLKRIGSGQGVKVARFSERASLGPKQLRGTELVRAGLRNRLQRQQRPRREGDRDHLRVVPAAAPLSGLQSGRPGCGVPLRRRSRRKKPGYRPLVEGTDYTMSLLSNSVASGQSDT